MLNLISSYFLKIITNYKTALYVSKNQYRVKFLHWRSNKKCGAFVFIQVALKRSKIKMNLSEFYSNKSLLEELNPVDAGKVSFLANLDSNEQIAKAPGFLNAKNSSPNLIEKPYLTIKNQIFDEKSQLTIFTLNALNTEEVITASALNIMQNESIIYGLGNSNALIVGYAASNDFMINIEAKPYTTYTDNVCLKYYHIICSLYLGLGLAGLCIVRRMFPFHLPFTDLVVPFGAGVIFFPLIFALQDTTTEVYGYDRSRHMIWLSIGITIFFILYTQLAINLPTGVGEIYKDNDSFSIVFGSIPRQFGSFVISLFTGMLLNDFLISKFKVKYGGRYLWARIIFSTMIGEAVVNIVGLIIGFGDLLNFRTEILPNIALSYGYKLVWNVALIPFIYMITNYLKKKEGIDIYDYDINYNPFAV
jgi:uncharacterized integral membrane protein (TIGR00697 family)